ncbi:MAG: response regulator, partial [Candidatus Omnitrophota bacterium]|nr:response regulator [Candidatus Omnitrophota bacterium]
MIKFLIVDDEQDVVDNVSELFTLRTYAVITASSGRKALELVEKEKPNIIILDIRMPDINGIDVLKEVKKNYPKIRVIMLTGIEDEATKNMAMALGASGYFTKPYSYSELLDISRKLIQEICQEEGIK